jgi:hypothetical protein
MRPIPYLRNLARVARNNAEDDLYRAKTSFRGFADDAMQVTHGASGRTRAQVLAGYQERYDEAQAAVNWLEELRQS